MADRTAPCARRRCAVFPEILLAPVAQPHPEHLRNLLFFFLRKCFVQPDRTVALGPASLVLMGVPVTPCEPYQTTNLFHKGFSRKRFSVFCHSSFPGRPVRAMRMAIVRSSMRQLYCMDLRFDSAGNRLWIVSQLSNECSTSPSPNRGGGRTGSGFTASGKSF